MYISIIAGFQTDYNKTGASAPPAAVVHNNNNNNIYMRVCRL